MRFLSDTFDEYFKYKRDSMLHVMGLLLVSLFILSASVHILLNTVFAGSISSLAQWKVFGPEYLTLIVSYILLRTRRLQLATHVFFIGHGGHADVGYILHLGSNVLYIRLVYKCSTDCRIDPRSDQRYSLYGVDHWSYVPLF